MRALVFLLALTSCAHTAPPSPAESTALAVDSAGLIVDVVSYLEQHFTPSSAPPPTWPCRGVLPAVPHTCTSEEIEAALRGAGMLAELVLDAGAAEVDAGPSWPAEPPICATWMPTTAEALAPSHCWSFADGGSICGCWAPVGEDLCPGWRGALGPDCWPAGDGGAACDCHPDGGTP